MSESVLGLPPLSGSETLGEQLRNAIEAAILDGTLDAGVRIHPDELAAHFGVSRIPVREALRALDASGWVEIRPRHGVYVRQRHADELEQLFEVRAPLEAQACRLAAHRRSDADIAALRALAADAIDAADDPKRYATANSGFHTAVVEAANNEVLASTLRGLRLRVQWYFAAAPPKRTKPSIEEHLEIVDAIEAGDAERAGAIGEKHVLDTLTVLREKIATGEIATAGA
ncbi:MAG: GntR family transcriptional regulator [Nitriliruptoraceae bacterium]|nr:GntR family transcriptional regulator [Nitriliruptoraceae bacterium]